jgi:KaiC/GvpD/RAD55 family RecA-like ATPase
MDEKVMSQLDAELEHAGEETALSPQMLLLEQLRITPEKQLPKMDFLFQLFGRPCFPRRELVAVTGKAKSGKTFVTSMLIACCVIRDVLSFHRSSDNPLRVLWYDTEQSDESTQDILKNRIQSLIKTKTNQTNDLFNPPPSVESNIDVFNVRSVAWKDRRQLLLEAVSHYGPDLVIVDGIRDLVNDINDGVLAQEVMEELMHLADEQNCCIVCILHQNKGSEDHNLRGWIGTELMNKAFEVYACEKLMPKRIFKVEQTLTRKYDIEQQLYFEVDQQGLPRLTAAPIEGRGNSKERLQPLNREYIITEDDGSWHFDTQRLFLDVFSGREELCGSELRSLVMQQSGISVPFVYNRVLKEALENGHIQRSSNGRNTVYRPAPF